MYQFRLIALPHLITSLFSLFLAFFVLRRKIDRKTVIFSIFIIGTAFWQLANVFVLSSQTPEGASIWSKIAYIGVIFIPIAMYRFSNIFI